MSEQNISEKEITTEDANVVGMKIKGKSKMIISSGLGTHSINLRINNLPQIVCIDLESKNQE